MERLFFDTYLYLYLVMHFGIVLKSGLKQGFSLAHFFFMRLLFLPQRLYVLALRIQICVLSINFVITQNVKRDQTEAIRDSLTSSSRK